MYEYLAIARERVLQWIRPLSIDEYEREFPIGLNTLARTLTHILASEWYYVRRMAREEVPPYEQWPLRDEAPPAFEALERAWSDQARITKSVVTTMRDWESELEYRITDDAGQRVIVVASPSDIFAQLVLHEVHHRAQAMNMLRRLGVAAEDLDFNALMYKRRPAAD